MDANEGEWLIYRDYRISVWQITKVTPKLFKLDDAVIRYPSQIKRDDRRIICAVADRETADRLAQSIAGIDGEYERRSRAADADRNERIKAARAARDKAVAKLIEEFAA